MATSTPRCRRRCCMCFTVNCCIRIRATGGRPPCCRSRASPCAASTNLCRRSKLPFQLFHALPRHLIPPALTQTSPPRQLTLPAAPPPVAQLPVPDSQPPAWAPDTPVELDPRALLANLRRSRRGAALVPAASPPRSRGSCSTTLPLPEPFRKPPHSLPEPSFPPA